ncbi:hypothetical protein J8I26_04305 [Herbaspirillum sp. LeCh32-8]|uniref:hypothetical protein n=1 Tax=Herbaspirillum sp. LeCh32-8 TaxID=2821356 RepID=UPI001AE7E098|nr:hypothetical protein [Herbaspirillum sp. LeCh32-8]MBP0597313.1 hypothetical protein [Herbaspirillum sp. LeCh32-8]
MNRPDLSSLPAGWSQALSLPLLQQSRPDPAPAVPGPARIKPTPKPPAVARAAEPEARPAPRPAPPQRAQRHANQGQASPRAAPRQLTERDTRSAAAQDALSAAGLPLLLVVDGQGGQRGQGGGGGNDGEEQAGGAGGASVHGTVDAAAELDCALLAASMPVPGEEGIFDVLLPCGARLGVAVDIGQRSTSILLMPSTERLRAQIKKKKTELENRLAQRMETPVRLTVL